MTPTQKAKELYDKMKGFRVKNSHRKKCALVAVDEIDLFIQRSTPKDDPYLNLQSLEYWQEVKQEIEKL